MGDRTSRDVKVLLVEDDENTRLFMRLQLEENGFIVVEAEDGQKAVDVAVNELPHVILMDLTLPVMDGFHAAKLIREQNALRQVPIIAVTAHVDTEFRSDAKNFGFNAYVTKPMDFHFLKELIEGLLI
jgi:CheY-like chemotaxis protein